MLRNGVDYCGSDASLVACYQLDEGSGNIYLDEVLNNVYNDGLTVNSPAWVTGKVGQALSFDGTANTALPRTIPAWTSRTRSPWQPGSNPEIDWNPRSNQEGGQRWHRMDMSWHFHLQPAQPGTHKSILPHQPTIPAAIVPGQFGLRLSILMAPGFTSPATFDGIDHAYLYQWRPRLMHRLQGRLLSLPMTYRSLSGRRYNGTTATRRFQGTMDDVRVYNRALSAAEIEALFLQPTAASLINLSADPQSRTRS